MELIDAIIVSREAQEHARAAAILKNFPAARVLDEDDGAARGDGPGLTLRLEVFKGSFIKPCPCSRGVLGCGYFVLSPLKGCPFSCSYCALKGYLDRSPITAYVNLDDMFAQLDEFLEKRSGRMVRIGTGELADSLALEPGLGMASELVEYFGGKDNAFFELKTKSANVDFLEGLAHGGRTVAGFSINPEEAAAREEPGSASTEARILAAARAARMGYRTAFHFDPVIDLDPPADVRRSTEPYREVIKLIFERTPAERIAWISLGALRFTSALYHELRASVPGGRIMLGEFIAGFDKKMRYPRHRRRELLCSLAEMIREHLPEAPLYLCMEDAGMVERVLGARSLPF